MQDRRSTDPTQETWATVNRAYYTVFTRRHELDHTDHTDHTRSGIDLRSALKDLDHELGIDHSDHIICPSCENLSHPNSTQCSLLTDDRFPLDDLDLSGQIICIPDVYDLAHVAAWGPCNLHDLGHISCFGSVLYRSGAASPNGRLGSRL